MKSYKTFNIACILIAGFFVLSIAYASRGMFANRTKYSAVVEEIETFEYREMKDRAEAVALKVSEPSLEEPEDFDSHTAQQESEQESDTDALPKKINLAVPFTSQAPEKNWDQPWQDACEEAAVLMLDAYYKEYDLSPLFARDEILKMVAWEEASEQGWERSIDIEKIKRLAEWQFGGTHTFSTIENPTVEQIKGFIAAGHPVYVVAYGKKLPNPHFQNGGPEYHALIIRGYTEDSFITNDPGTQFGENFVYTYDELMNAIHDWNGGDVKEGARVVFVLAQ
jgi:hypothetical protein